MSYMVKIGIKNYIISGRWYFTLLYVIINLLIYLYRMTSYRSLTEYISSLFEIKPNNTTYTLIYYFFKLCLLNILHILTNYLLKNEISIRVNRIFSDLVKKMVFYKLDFYNKYGKEEFISIWSYLYNIEGSIKNIILNVPKKIIYILYYGYSIYNFSLSALGTIMAINILVLITLHPLSLLKYNYQKERMMMDIQTKNNYSELINNISHIKLSMKEDDEKNRILKSYCEYHDNKKKDDNISYLTITLSEIINDLITFVIYIIGALYVISGSMKPIELLYLAVHTSRFYDEIKSLKDVYDDYVKISPKLQMVMDMLNYNEYETNNNNDTYSDGKIVFDNVSFSYGKNIVLSNKSFIFEQNKINILIGTNGSGKSTIVNLMLKLYDNNSGSILYNGTDIKNIPTHVIRNNISVIHQDALLFDETLLYNITYGVKNSDYDNILRLATDIDFNTFLENNKNMKIGNMGCKLSGGEKKKIQLLNTLLKNSKIIILDEPTNSLDMDTSMWLIDYIKKMVSVFNKTVIIITHDKRLLDIGNNIININQL